MDSARLERLSAAVATMPDGPSRERFRGLVAELSEPDADPDRLGPVDGADPGDAIRGLLPVPPPHPTLDPVPDRYAAGPLVDPLPDPYAADTVLPAAGGPDIAVAPPAAYSSPVAPDPVTSALMPAEPVTADPATAAAEPLKKRRWRKH